MIRYYLLDARNEVGISNAYEMSERSNITRQYYASLESGGKGGQLTLLTAKKLSSALNMNLEKFYELEKKYQDSCYREKAAKKAKLKSAKDIINNY